MMLQDPVLAVACAFAVWLAFPLLVIGVLLTAERPADPNDSRLFDAYDELVAEGGVVGQLNDLLEPFRLRTTMLLIAWPVWLPVLVWRAYTRHGGRA